MPYRRRGSVVQVKRGSRWETVKTHRNAARAKRHLTALNINVGHKGVDELLALAEDPDFWAGLYDEVFPEVEGVLLDAYLEGVRLATAANPVGQRALTISQAQVDAINARALEFVRGFTNQWWSRFLRARQQALRNAILRAFGLDGGEALGLDHVKRVMGQLLSPRQADLIAVTEVTRVMGQAAVETYAVAGIQQWQWNTAEDARVCPICDGLQASSPYPVDQAFEPGHPGCRCFPVPVAA